MPMTADQILDQIRALTTAERLHVVERIVHEIATDATPQPAEIAASIWNDETDAEFEAFQTSVQQLRADDVWRIGDAKDAP